MAFKEEKVYVTSRKKKANVRRETSAVSDMRVTIVRKNRHGKPPHLLSQQWTRGDSWVVYFKTQPPESLSILRKGTKILGSIRKVRFTQSTPRQASIRENKRPSLGKIQVKIPHQRSSLRYKFEDRSQEKTERQEQCARGKAWNLAKHIYKLKEKDKATFYSPTDKWIMPAASTRKPGGKRVCGRFWSKYAHGQEETLTLPDWRP